MNFISTKIGAGIVSAAMFLGQAAWAAPVNGTGDVTPDVIFGTGNANGDFTGVNQNGVELGLRGKLRYDNSNDPLPGSPAGVYNYDGNKTYTFQPSEGIAPADRSLFNFDWTINTDPSGSSGVNLNDLTYLFEIDYDPTVGTNFTTAYDPINAVWADHSIGNNSTGNSAGVEAPKTLAGIGIYQGLIANNNVAQNSWNLGFFEPFGFDPQTEGMFTINLSAFGGNSQLLAKTSIDIIYGQVPAPIPLPASLPLLFAALGGMGLIARRRRRSS